MGEGRREGVVSPISSLRLRRPSLYSRRRHCRLVALVLTLSDSRPETLHAKARPFQPRRNTAPHTPSRAFQRLLTGRSCGALRAPRPPCTLEAVTSNAFVHGTGGLCCPSLKEQALRGKNSCSCQPQPHGRLFGSGLIEPTLPARGISGGNGGGRCRLRGNRIFIHNVRALDSTTRIADSLAFPFLK